MSDLFNYYTLPEEAFLENLIDDLEGSFHVIAHTDYVSDNYFIKTRIQEIKNEYGPFMHLPLDSNLFTFRVLPAYRELESLLDGNPSIEEIISRCEDGLAYLTVNEEFSEDDMGDFADYFEKYGGT
ncbi:hypothetical protein J4437_02305 [Candidatus Woesearchaeota archaeon]|nr:hypothetical protein [Candidatus Woesearchaeota archaeon]